MYGYLLILTCYADQNKSGVSYMQVTPLQFTHIIEAMHKDYPSLRLSKVLISL